MGEVRYLRGVCALLVLPLLMAPATSTAQTAPRITEYHLSGQSIAPSFEGWEPNKNGTFSLYYGYLNRNHEEKLDIPVGPNNLMEPGPDQGQPTHFLTGRRKNIFSVVVPKDFGDKKIVWTLSIRGNTEKAIGSLNPIYLMDVSRDRVTGNTPPVMKVGPDQTITLPAAATLTVAATDDGLPKRRGGAGITVAWSKYRGPGNVTFAPATEVVVDGKATTKATFTAPGTYTIRVIASDAFRESRTAGAGAPQTDQAARCCWTNGEIQVTVNAAPTTAGQR